MQFYTFLLMTNGKKKRGKEKKERKKRKMREIARYARHDTPFLRGKRSGSEINLKRD